MCSLVQKVPFFDTLHCCVATEAQKGQNMFHSFPTLLEGEDEEKDV